MENRSLQGKWLVAILASLFMLQTFAFAATPGVVTNYIQVFLDLAQGKIGQIFIIAILGFSGFLAWKNGNVTPFLWGLAAAVLIGGAPYIAPKIITFGNTTFGG